MERPGRPVQLTYEANPGEVWEEGEFWIEVSWRADPDGSLGIRKFYDSPYRPGEKITLAEYYRWMFEHSVPGLPEKAAAEGLDPLEYMRRYGAVEVPGDVYAQHECEVAAGGAEVRGEEQTVTRVAFDGAHLPLTGRPDTVAAMVDGVPRRGFNTPSRKLEIYSETLAEWAWPEHATPGYVRSHVHQSLIDHALVDMAEAGEAVTFRQQAGVQPWESDDASSRHVWWSDAGVHQNIAFPVHPDPVSGMHCWHQKVRVRPAEPGDRYADIHVDFGRARSVYRKWLALARPAAGELRRPIWLFRPVKPQLDAYALPDDDRTRAARAAAAEPRPHPDRFAAQVDWSPSEVWGAGPAHPR